MSAPARVMRRSELVAVRAADLEPGRRALFPRAETLATVVAVDTDGHGVIHVHTDLGVYLCAPNDLIDAEEISEVWPTDP